MDARVRLSSCPNRRTASEEDKHNHRLALRRFNCHAQTLRSTSGRIYRRDNAAERVTGRYGSVIGHDIALPGTDAFLRRTSTVEVEMNAGGIEQEGSRSINVHRGNPTTGCSLH